MKIIVKNRSKIRTKQHKVIKQMNHIDARTKIFGCIMLVLQKLNKNMHTYTQPSSHKESRQQPVNKNDNNNKHKIIQKKTKKN